MSAIIVLGEQRKFTAESIGTSSKPESQIDKSGEFNFEEWVFSLVLFCLLSLV